MPDLNNKVAIITGAGQGVGRGIAFAMTDLGARVVAAGRTLEKVENTVREIEQQRRRYLSTTGHGKPCGNPGRPLSKAKYSWQPIVNQYREGKVKRTP